MGSLNVDPTLLTLAMKIFKIMVHIRKGVQSEKHHIKNNCLWYFTVWKHIRADPRIFQKSPRHTETPPLYNQAEEVQMVSTRVQFCRYGCGRRCNKICVLQK